MEISLKNKYRSELLSSCTESNQHVPLCEKSIRWYTNGDEAVAFKKKGGAVIGLLLPGSNPIHFPLLCLRHGREILGTIYSLPAGFLLRILHHCSARRSTSTPKAHSDGLPVFPSQLCEEAPHLSEGGSMAAQRSLPHPFNSFSTALTKTGWALLLGCTNMGRWVNRSRGHMKVQSQQREKNLKTLQTWDFSQFKTA